MGWTYPYGATRKSLIEDRTKPWERESNGCTTKSTCLAHCFRGGRFSGVLWAIWKRTIEKNGQQAEPEQRWITCDLIRCHAGEWGYKDMSESCGPFYFSCPLKYLDLVPIESYGVSRSKSITHVSERNDGESDLNWHRSRHPQPRR